MLPSDYNPNPTPLTQAELDELAAKQRAMGGSVPAGGYQAAPVEEPAGGSYFPPVQTYSAPPPPPQYAPVEPGMYEAPYIAPGQYASQAAAPPPAAGPFGLPTFPSGRPTLDFMGEVGLPTRDFTEDVVGTGVQMAHDANDYSQSLVRPTPLWDYTIWSRAEKSRQRQAARRRAEQSAAGSYEAPNRYGEREVPFVNVEDALMGPISGPITPGQYLPRIAGAGHRGAAGADMARRAATAQDAFGAWLDERLPPY